MSYISKRRRDGAKPRFKSMGNHEEFLKRIEKTLYYGQLPTLPCLSLPVTEISCSLWSASQRGRSLRRLRAGEAAELARGACVSPCALVLAILYLERLHACNPDYLANTAPADLFLVSLMVSNKFLQDDGEDDEVICSEWAVSGRVTLHHLKKLESEFLNAIDWRVFVSEDDFESCLQWLEQQVALKQATLRGFFTYGDLAAAGGGGAGSVGAAAAACLSLTLAYAATLGALLASSLLVTLPALPGLSSLPAALTPLARAPPLPLPAHNPHLPHFNNATVELAEDELTEPLRCCTKWLNYRQETEQRNWQYDLLLHPWDTADTFNTWWSNTPVLNWLYQRSLINPKQRWLEKFEEIGQFIKKELFAVESTRKGHREVCNGGFRLNKMGALLASVSDR